MEKYGFQLNLLSDVGGAVRKQYEVPPSLFGALDGRVTYVVGKDQKIKLIYDNQVSKHTHICMCMCVLCTLPSVETETDFLPPPAMYVYVPTQY